MQDEQTVNSSGGGILPSRDELTQMLLKSKSERLMAAENPLAILQRTSSSSSKGNPLEAVAADGQVRRKSAPRRIGTEPSFDGDGIMKKEIGIRIVKKNKEKRTPSPARGLFRRKSGSQ